MIHQFDRIVSATGVRETSQYQLTVPGDGTSAGGDCRTGPVLDDVASA